MDLKGNPRLAYVFVNLSTLLWASNIALGRSLRDTISPITLTTARFLFAGILFAAITRTNLTQLRSLKQDWRILMLMAATGVFAFPIVLYLALKYTTATHIALINGVSPLITIFLAAVFLEEHITLNRILGGLISLCGVYLVISNGSLQFLTNHSINIGDLLGLLCAFLWGLYSIFSRKATQYRTALSATSISIWMALPLLFTVTTLEWHSSPPEITPSVILAAVYIGIFPTVIAFFLWNESVRRVGAGHAMAFYNMLPIYGTLLGIIFLREKVSWSLLTGGILVIFGSLIAIREKVTREKIVRHI